MITVEQYEKLRELVLEVRLMENKAVSAELPYQLARGIVRCAELADQCLEFVPERSK